MNKQHTPISEEETNLILKYQKEGKSLGKIALLLKRKKKTIYNFFIKQNIPIEFSDERSRPWTLIELNNLKEMVNNGTRYRDICKRINRSLLGIKTKLYELKLESPFAAKIRINKELYIKNLKKCYICQEIKSLNKFLKWSKCCENCRLKKSKNRNEQLANNSDINIIIKERFMRIRERVHKWNIPFDLTLEYLIELYETQKHKCFYTGRTLVLKTNNIDSISIDRIDSSKGYTKNNVVLCGKTINNMKNDMNMEDFKKIIKDSYNNMFNI